MTHPANLDERELKKALKEVLIETLEERRELFVELFEEVLQDYAIYPLNDGEDGEALRKGVMFASIEGKA
jgi:hypothetical protein